MKNLMNKIFTAKKGQGTMEYVIIFLVVVMVVMGGLAVFGFQMNKSLENQTTQLVQSTNNALCVQATDNAKPYWKDSATPDGNWASTECSATQ